MPYNSNRVERISEEVTKELAMLLRNVKDPRVSQTMLSVVRCEVTNDMRWCKVFLSALGECDQKELKKGLKSCSGFLRRELAHRLRLRYTPELVFVLDDSIAHGAHIAAVLKLVDGAHHFAQFFGMECVYAGFQIFCGLAGKLCGLVQIFKIETISFACHRDSPLYRILILLKEAQKKKQSFQPFSQAAARSYN